MFDFAPIPDEWEALGLDKRSDYENLRRVFDRIAGGKPSFDARDLEDVFRSDFLRNVLAYIRVMSKIEGQLH